MTFPCTITFQDPDGNEVEERGTVDAHYERNPGDKEPAHYHGEDDGWVVDSVSLE